VLDRAHDSHFFKFDPLDHPFPTLPMPAVCGRSILTLQASASPSQLVWAQARGSDRFLPRYLPLESPAMSAGDIVGRICTDAPNSRVLARVVDHAVLRVFAPDDRVPLPTEALVCFALEGMFQRGQGQGIA
jgi:hypothetical protein